MPFLVCFLGQKAEGKGSRSVLPRMGQAFRANGKLQRPRSGKKGFNWLVRSCSFGVLIRGLENLEAPFGKVLILSMRSRYCGELNRGLQNLDVLCKENGLSLFALCKK